MLIFNHFDFKLVLMLITSQSTHVPQHNYGTELFLCFVHAHTLCLSSDSEDCLEETSIATLRQKFELLLAL